MRLEEPAATAAGRRAAALNLSPLRRFYTTEPTACPYLPARTEQRVVTSLHGVDGEDGLSVLTALGFRRSQSWLYRPACPTCRACVPVRIVAGRFVPSRRYRKVLARNADLTVRCVPPRATDEQYELFHRYQAGRHAGGGMAQMDRGDFAAMVEDAAAGTFLAELRYADGRLAGVSLTDRLEDGLSGVYKFFDPEAARRSLGTFIVLWHIGKAVALRLPYVYLGYWIEGSRTMDYKRQFQPLERLTGRLWRPLPPAAAEPGAPAPPPAP